MHEELHNLYVSPNWDNQIKEDELNDEMCMRYIKIHTQPRAF